MKCPKCKMEMINIVNGFGRVLGVCCNNTDCWFHGIERHCEDVMKK